MKGPTNLSPVSSIYIAYWAWHIEGASVHPKDSLGAEVKQLPGFVCRARSGENKFQAHKPANAWHSRKKFVAN